MRNGFYRWVAWPWLGAVVLGLVTALVLSGCGGGGANAGGGGAQQVTVKMSEYKFDPDTITVKANQPVRLTVQNTGSVKHDWTVKGMDPAVSVAVDPGKSATTEFTPTKPGTYEIDCTQPGHAESGMKGKLVVQ